MNAARSRKPAIFIVISVLVVGLIYSLYSVYNVFAVHRATILPDACITNPGGLLEYPTHDLVMVYSQLTV